jgi:RNA polymerase sigma-70 factor (ECF subfamily)
MTTHSTSGGTRPSLLARACRRDAAAWRELVELYSPLVAHWSQRCGLEAQEVADCLQDVFASVATSLGSFEPRAANGAFRAWLWTITRNKVRDRARGKLRQPRAVGGSSAAAALASTPDPASLPDDEPTGAGQLNALARRGLEQVRSEFEPHTWQAFWRTVIDGIPSAVVARELGVSSAAIRQSRSRVLRRLRQQLGDS